MSAEIDFGRTDIINCQCTIINCTAAVIYGDIFETIFTNITMHHYLRDRLACL